MAGELDAPSMAGSGEKGEGGGCCEEGGEASGRVEKRMPVDTT